jgi:hypothetical protein
MLQKGVMHLVAAIAQTNKSHAHAVIRAPNAGVAQSSRQPGPSGEITAGKLSHVTASMEDVNR